MGGTCSLEQLQITPPVGKTNNDVIKLPRHDIQVTLIITKFHLDLIEL